MTPFGHRRYFEQVTYLCSIRSCSICEQLIVHDEKERKAMKNPSSGGDNESNSDDNGDWSLDL